MKKVMFMALTAIAFSASAQPSKQVKWTKEPASVFGIQLGSELDDRLIPYCIDSDLPTPEMLPFCSEDPRDGRGITEIQRLPIPEFGTGQIARHRGVVSAVRFTGSNENYQRIKDILVERYGRPAATTGSSVQNKIGASFKSEEAIWAGSRVSILLEQRHGTIDQFLITFSHMATAKKLQQQDQQRTKSAADRL